MVGSGTRNARAISAVVSPPSSRRVSATWAPVAERRMAAGEDKPQPVIAHGALLLGGSSRACSSAAWACLSARAASRRRRSMARWRAVVMIHPAGLGGSPARGQRRAASANASWTASSAMSMSPKTRVRTATARPYSVTEDALDVGGRERRHGHGQSSAIVLERPHLDRERCTRGVALRPHSSAASRSGALITQKPPMCSLPSANGPSVMSTSPPSRRTTVAVLAGTGRRRRPRRRRPASSAFSASTSAHDLLEDLGRRRMPVRGGTR